MREIKFRAWFVPTERMHNGVNLVRTSDGELVLEKHEGDRLDRQSLRFYSPVDAECVLMQFTGVKDINGREIYEGDIVRWDHGADKTDHGIDAIEFLAGAFCLTRPAGYRLDAFCRPFSNELTGNIEVIGNIYENPNLREPSVRRRSGSEADGDLKRRPIAS